jgi:RimJ/RimL family protein N-acetyltransferase
MHTARELEARETPRFRLRVPRESDLDTFASWVANEETMKWMQQPVLDRDEAWRVLAMLVGHWHFRGFGPWMIEEKATGALVGRGGLWRPEGWPGVEYSILVAPDVRAKGVATEVGRETMRCAFEVLRLDELFGFIAPWNSRSIALANTLGFEFQKTWQPQAGAILNVYSVQSGDYPRLRDSWTS